MSTHEPRVLARADQDPEAAWRLTQGLDAFLERARDRCDRVEPQVEMKAARRPLEGFEDVQVERHRRRDDFKIF